MTPQKLKTILNKHQKWLNDVTTEQVDDLIGADLRYADLFEANLIDIDLSGADLSHADLSHAILINANLCSADLRCADLRGADLRCADLRDAKLCDANLRDTDLRGVDLSNADLSGADLPDFSICPEEGSFIAYKKLQGNIIAKLQIPSSAKRTSSLIGRTCRCNKAKVIAFLNIDKTLARSNYDPRFIYTVGKTVSVKDYDDDIRLECTKGIHFFMTKKEAENY